MNFHEYQAKQLFAEFGIAVPPELNVAARGHNAATGSSLGGELLAVVIFG